MTVGSMWGVSIIWRGPTFGVLMIRALLLGSTLRLRSPLCVFWFAASCPVLGSASCFLLLCVFWFAASWSSAWQRFLLFASVRFSLFASLRFPTSCVLLLVPSCFLP